LGCHLTPTAKEGHTMNVNAWIEILILIVRIFAAGQML
jgi:hypothetical protein